MFLKNDILGINLAQYGENPTAGTQYTIELANRQTDEAAYSVTMAPTAATERLFRFDLVSLGIVDGQYIAVIKDGTTPITMFNVRTTKEEVKEFYTPGIEDSFYEN